jgi:hypothetical protein
MAGVVPFAREGWGRDPLWISRQALIGKATAKGNRPLQAPRLLSVVVLSSSKGTAAPANAACEPQRGWHGLQLWGKWPCRDAPGDVGRCGDGLERVSPEQPLQCPQGGFCAAERLLVASVPAVGSPLVATVGCRSGVPRH